VVATVMNNSLFETAKVTMRNVCKLRSSTIANNNHLTAFFPRQPYELATKDSDKMLTQCTAQPT